MVASSHTLFSPPIRRVQGVLTTFPIINLPLIRTRYHPRKLPINRSSLPVQKLLSLHQRIRESRPVCTRFKIVSVLQATVLPHASLWRCHGCLETNAHLALTPSKPPAWGQPHPASRRDHTLASVSLGAQPTQTEFSIIERPRGYAMEQRGWHLDSLQCGRETWFPYKWGLDGLHVAIK